MVLSCRSSRVIRSAILTIASIAQLIVGVLIIRFVVELQDIDVDTSERSVEVSCALDQDSNDPDGQDDESLCVLAFAGVALTFALMLALSVILVCLFLSIRDCVCSELQCRAKVSSCIPTYILTSSCLRVVAARISPGDSPQFAATALFHLLGAAGACMSRSPDTCAHSNAKAEQVPVHRCLSVT